MKLELWRNPLNIASGPGTRNSAALQVALENSEGTLDSTRAVYTFLNPICAFAS